MKSEENYHALVHSHCHMPEGEGKKAELERLRDLVAKLASAEAPYLRAYLFYQDYNSFVSGSSAFVAPHLVAYALSFSQALKAAPTCDELFETFFRPFGNFYTYRGVSTGYCSGLAKAFAQRWPDSAAVSTLRGLEEMYHAQNDIKALKHFEAAIKADKSYWFAAIPYVELLMQDNRFDRASNCLVQVIEAVLSSRSDEVKAELCDLLSQCYQCEAELLEKAGNYAEAEKHYCKYLQTVFPAQMSLWDLQYQNFDGAKLPDIAESQTHYSWYIPFRLEKYLQDELESRLGQSERVFNRKLTALRELRLNNGSERIDLYGTDVEKDECVIIELKRDAIDDVAIKQIKRYIGAEKQHPNQRVIGILCGHTVPDTTMDALKSISDAGSGYEIEAWEYRFLHGHLLLMKVYPPTE